MDLTSNDNFTLLAKDYGLDEGWQASTCRIGHLLVCRYRDEEPWSTRPVSIGGRRSAMKKIIEQKRIYTEQEKMSPDA